MKASLIPIICTHSFLMVNARSSKKSPSKQIRYALRNTNVLVRQLGENMWILAWGPNITTLIVRKGEYNAIILVLICFYPLTSCDIWGQGSVWSHPHVQAESSKTHFVLKTGWILLFFPSQNFPLSQLREDTAQHLNHRVQFLQSWILCRNWTNYLCNANYVTSCKKRIFLQNMNLSFLNSFLLQ